MKAGKISNQISKRQPKSNSKSLPVLTSASLSLQPCTTGTTRGRTNPGMAFLPVVGRGVHFGHDARPGIAVASLRNARNRSAADGRHGRTDHGPHGDSSISARRGTSWPALEGDQDQQALHQITVAHMRLVISMASKFRHYGLPLGDLVQEGHVGLLEAAARFEPEREVRFSTYATWWIRASMQDYILRNWSIVRGGTSSAQKALFFNLRRLRARLANGAEPISNATLYREVSVALGVSEADVAMMDSRLSAPDSSLNAPLADDTGPAERMDFLISDDPLPYEVASDTIISNAACCGEGSARRAQFARTQDHRGTPLERRRCYAGSARRDARYFQGACPPDRGPRPGKAQGGAGQAEP